MSAVITPFEGTELFNTASFNNRISQINTGFSYISNPNLLDNWYFGRPVNQRGQTEYTGNGYTVDRWLVEPGMTLKIANDGVVLESTGTDWWAGLLEKKECSLPARTTITFSVLGKFTGDTRLFLGTGGNDELKSEYFSPSGDWECVSVTATLESATNMLAVRVSPDTKNVKANCTLLAAKLELGPTQTLAHREGDKWVLNEVPDYGEQLRRCQMYYLGDMQRDAPGRISMGHVAYCIVPIPVTMRQSSAVPVQTFSNYGIITDKDGTSHVVNNASCVVEADSYLLFAVSSTDTMPMGPCIWQDAHFSISKDL